MGRMSLARFTAGMLSLAALTPQNTCAQAEQMETNPVGGPGQPITVEIWSDVVCPFCYIGKRELENALARFEQRDSVRVVWKSFELDPDAPDERGVDTYRMLMEKYGMTREQVLERTRSVRERAASLGLNYHFDKAIVGSSFQAHRLLQFAKSKGLGGAAKERLFKAYFTEGKHLANPTTLAALGVEIGLPAAEVSALLRSDAFSREVRADEQEACQLRVTGVPFFAFDRRLSVSGAQSEETFLEALRQVWTSRGT